MNYGQSAFEALVESIEGQGGAMLPETCTPEELSFKPPQKHIPGSFTQGCNNHSMAVVTYDPESDKAPSGSGYVRVCAVCDAVGAMPRFEGAVRPADDRYWAALEWDQPEDDIDPDDLEDV